VLLHLDAEAFVTGHGFATTGPWSAAPNHRDFHKMGWQSITIGDVPHWLPPTWSDPDQKPTRKPDHDL
jgi:hypothetical protein